MNHLIRGGKASMIIARLIVCFFILMITCLNASMVQAQIIDNQDSDGDGISNYLELNFYYTNPTKEDTDGDGFTDIVEIQKGFSPRDAGKALKEVDSDQDGVMDDWEYKIGSNILLN